MKHYRHVVLPHRGETQNTEPIVSPKDASDKPSYPQHHRFPAFCFPVLALLLPCSMATAATLNQKIDPGTLNPDNSGNSWAYSLSGDSSVIGGETDYTSSGVLLKGKLST